MIIEPLSSVFSMTQLLSNPENIIDSAPTPQEIVEGLNLTIDVSHLVIEDDNPVDNFQSAQQQRLPIDPLYSGKAVPLIPVRICKR